MHSVNFTITGASNYSQSRFLTEPKLPRETADAYEKRVWKTRIHRTAEGMIYIPPMALKQSLDAAAKYLGLQVPGKGKSTYTKHFTSGVLFTDPIVTDVHEDTVEGEWILANSDGVRGSGKRVQRCYPYIPAGYTAKASCLILDDIITKDIFEQHITLAGQLIGVGRFRPQNGGFYGRFTVSGLEYVAA